MAQFGSYYGRPMGQPMLGGQPSYVGGYPGAGFPGGGYPMGGGYAPQGAPAAAPQGYPAGGYGGYGAYGRPAAGGRPVGSSSSGASGMSQRTSGASAKVNREVSERAAAWTAKNQWDFDELPHPDGFRFYMSSVMYCAASDGELDPKERDWVLGYAAALGSPADLMKDLEGMTAQSLRTQDLGQDFDKFCARTDKRSAAAKRGIIYDCIRAAAADGEFHVDERRAVVDLAVKFGLNKDVVAELEALVTEEKALKDKKANLVHRYRG